jgi:glycosyltransferase involved in cell wall biosynthesis
LHKLRNDVMPPSQRCHVVVDGQHGRMGLTIATIVCAYNESRLLPGCLYSLRAQTRPPDDILVINNASTDETGAVARAVPGVRLIDEPCKGLVVARETARLAAHADIVAYMDADCRAPITWLERVEAHFSRPGAPVAVTGPYRFYDWDWSGRALVRAYDLLVAPPTHAVVHHAFGVGAILYGGNFAVRSDALARIGGFDRRIDFHGEDANLGRRLTAMARRAVS